jgi:IclR family transcriptional regulator, acetate operon repressor
VAVTEPKPARTGVRSVIKASEMLRLVAERDDPITATEAAGALGIPTPTAYHLLNTLVGEGLLVKDHDRRYSLGPTVGLLADSFLSRIAPPRFLLTPLGELAEETGETCYMSGWRSGEIVVLQTVEGDHPVRVKGLHRGFAGLAHARASGKLLLSEVDATRRERYLSTHPLTPVTDKTITDPVALEAEFVAIKQRGYATDDEEFTEGVRCLAASVYARRAAGADLLGAFTLAAPRARFEANEEALVASLLKWASAAGAAEH